MIGKTHALTGACAALALNATGVGVVLATFGAVLPDIDCATSIVGKHAKTLATILPHRGPTHSLLFLFLSLCINPWLALGVLTHIVLDMINPRGLLLFWPFKTKVKFPLGKAAPTGGKFELILQIVLIAISVYFCIKSLSGLYIYTMIDIAKTKFSEIMSLLNL